jgi:hypothetical protein
MEIIDWFKKNFGAEDIEWKYPARLDGGRAFVLLHWDELDDARECSKLNPLPVSPVLPVLVGWSIPGVRPPPKYVQVTSASVSSEPPWLWGIDIKGLNDTLAVMDGLRRLT